MSDENAKLTGLDAATREQWAREALHGIELRTKRFGEFVGAVRELIATLPKCSHYCGRPATHERDVWVDEGHQYAGKDRACDADTAGPNEWEESTWAPALRKLQAILDPEETEKP